MADDMQPDVRQDTSAALSAGGALLSKDSATLSDHADHVNSTALSVIVAAVSGTDGASSSKTIAVLSSNGSDGGQARSNMAESSSTPGTGAKRKAHWRLEFHEHPMYSKPPWDDDGGDRVNSENFLLHGPSTTPISLDHLIAEVKGIYAGYSTIEKKCIEVDEAQTLKHQIHSIDVIPFLLVMPYSLLARLQRGQVDVEKVIRETLLSSLERIERFLNECKGDATPSYMPLFIARAFAIRSLPSNVDLDVPTIDECVQGFVYILKSRARDYAWPGSQASTHLTTTTMGDEGRAEVVVKGNAITVGRDLLAAIDKATEEANDNIAERALRTPFIAEAEANGNAKEEDGLDANDAKCKRCNKKKKKKKRKEKLKRVLADNRPLDDPSRYQKIGEIYYMRVQGRWMNVSLTNDQYHALGRLHGAGIDEMHDFLLASNHPRASKPLKELAAKYGMPARLWKHGVYGHLEVLRARMPESSEHMLVLLIRSYSMMQLLEETTDSRYFTVECAGDLARYRFAIEDQDADVKRHWKEVAINKYNMVSDMDPTAGRLYHHLSILSMDNYSARFFNVLKALTVSRPFATAWKTMITTTIPHFVAPKGQTSTKLDQVLSLDEDNLYTAIARLVLAAAPSEELEQSGFDTCKATHLLAFGASLPLVAGINDPKSTVPPKLFSMFRTAPLPQPTSATINWAPSSVGPASQYADVNYCIHEKTTTADASHATQGEYAKKADATAPSSRGLSGWAVNGSVPSSPTDAAFVQNYAVRPSPELGLVLCQLLLLVDNSAVVDRATQLLSAVNIRFLTRPVTQDLKLWEYLHVLLVFMRCLNSRPELKERCGYAFHVELMAPLLDLLVRRLEDRGGEAWEMLFRNEFPMQSVPLNARHKPGKYGVTGIEAQREYLARKREQQPKSAMADDTTAKATGSKQGQEAQNIKPVKLGEERLFTVVLPEDRLLRGFPFALQAPSPREPKKPLSDKQIAAKKWEDKQLRKSERKVYDSENESDSGESLHLDPQPAEADEADWTDEEDEEDVSDEDDITVEENNTPEAVDEEDTDSLARDVEEARHLDSCFYPPGFFEKSKFDLADELAWRDGVQDADVTDYRELRIIWTAVSGQSFFSLQTDKNGDYAIGVPGAESVPGPYFDAKMPEFNVCDNGSQVAHVNPAVEEVVVKPPSLWEKREQELLQMRHVHEEAQREVRRKTQEEDEKRQQEEKQTPQIIRPQGSILKKRDEELEQMLREHEEKQRLQITGPQETMWQKREKELFQMLHEHEAKQTLQAIGVQETIWKKRAMELNQMPREHEKKEGGDDEGENSDGWTVVTC
ncbi:hypothetical protein BKA56DRAFT_676504 [Ilyonectria sp. MPI-CAGE-AT-0026]|nr:hypothetical protein BKA56DRAFT_676504 [Ilyonectria sp. MPI-CAGE-AT-0026]